MASELRVLPMGDTAILLETSDISAVLTVTAALTPLAAAGDGVWSQVQDVVPAARTVLVHAREGTDLAELGRSALAAGAAALGDPSSAAGTAAPGPVVEIPVRYDGPDLADVAGHTGLTPAEVVAAHTGTPWRVGFGGFAPGFAYLVGGDERLVVPRRAEPRPRVPAGAVALAGDFSGIYPRESPGGWQLLGTTDAVLWDEGRQPPALLVPGASVRFVAVAGPGVGR